MGARQVYSIGLVRAGGVADNTALSNELARGGRLRLQPDDLGRLACPNPLDQNMQSSRAGACFLSGK